jgi:signal transduction histidine kinase
MTHEFARELNIALHTDGMEQSQQPVIGEFSCTSRTLDELVHELRQPLSTIECLTYYLELVCTDSGTRSHLERIQDMVVQANRILEHASNTLSH